MSSGKSVLRLHNCDARELRKILERCHYYRKFVDATVTSPPYYDVKTYGYENQIGHGQQYLEYLNDLEEIFKEVYKITNDTGSLWVIVDAIVKDGIVINLPFEISERLSCCGWNLTDTIIWKKDKTLPWSRKGQMRNIFEYILFFTKSDRFKFHADRIRISDLSKLKQWWTKYPERYNPKGALPTNVWEYPIPTQGSWSKKSLRHFNPLPAKMIERILLLTTDQGDVVLDPLAGSGTVLAVADFLNRRWLGFEMNREYCAAFEKKVLNEIKKEMLTDRKAEDEIRASQHKFEKMIRDLRLVKFPKSLIKELNRRQYLDPKRNHVNTVFATSRTSTGDKGKIPANKLMIEDIFLVFDNDVETNALKRHIHETISKPPLSKFGIEPRFYLLDRERFVLKHSNTFQDLSLWLYASGVVYKFEKPITFTNWLSESKKPHWEKYSRKGTPPIISNVKVNQAISRTWMPRKEKFDLVKDIFETAIGTKTDVS